MAPAGVGRAEGSHYAEQERMLVFLVAATIYPMMVQAVSRLGIPTTSFLLPCCQYCADLLLGLAQGSRPSFVPRTSSVAVKALLVAIPLLDMGGAVLTYHGIASIGSALFQSFFSSLLVVTAAFSRIILGRALSERQLVGSAIITAALAYKGHLAIRGAETVQLSAGGAASTFGAVLCYSLRTVLMDAAQQYKSISKPQLASTVGGWGFCGTGLYVLAQTVPNWKRLVSDPLVENGSTASYALALVLAFMLARAFYVNSMYNVLETSGSNGTALINSVRSASVLVASSALYCSRENPSQCLTPESASVATVIAAGGAIYALPEHSSQRKRE